MAPTKTGKAAKSPAAQKEKVFHPQSRKAGQLARKALRKGKLGNLGAKRVKKADTVADFYSIFYHAIPDDGSVLTLEDLHSIARDVWLTRHDEELAVERAQRRKGRPKSMKEMKLEEISLREVEDYRTGIDVPDLTHAPTVALFRQWDMKEVAFMRLLQFVRISSANPETAVVARRGTHVSMGTTDPGDANPTAMDLKDVLMSSADEGMPMDAEG
ncbi:hypothetical protein FISHEDRAFT_63629 [Fistulina hepatica ATCC 64428]|uniref:Translation machinery-associated protein 16 n=1 Tax=Fistulina hepatica ATCC 64428 TaxID=1128425 RepID=A0A0D7AN33_9AGAR|nr:hypothetical protein FISHEDRAFT_63629 [Fistulina hepatica ATCC 64428]